MKNILGHSFPKNLNINKYFCSQFNNFDLAGRLLVSILQQYLLFIIYKIYIYLYLYFTWETTRRRGKSKWRKVYIYNASELAH